MKGKIKQYIDLIPKKDIPKWLEVIRKRQKVSKNIFNYITSKYIPFNYMQLNEIFIGLQNGLSKEQILHYAEPKIDAYRMKNIRVDLEETTQCNKLLKILADISNNVDGD